MFKSLKIFCLSASLDQPDTPFPHLVLKPRLLCSPVAKLHRIKNDFPASPFPLPPLFCCFLSNPWTCLFDYINSVFPARTAHREHQLHPCTLVYSYGMGKSGLAVAFMKSCLEKTIGHSHTHGLSVFCHCPNTIGPRLKWLSPSNLIR
jgi:hypothetical protein